MSLTIGYLVEFGYLNLPRFHKYLEELSQVSNFPFNLHYFKMHYIYIISLRYVYSLKYGIDKVSCNGLRQNYPFI